MVGKIPFAFSCVLCGKEGGILVEVDATVGEFSEGSLLLDLGGLLGVVFVLW